MDCNFNLFVWDINLWILSRRLVHTVEPPNWEQFGPSFQFKIQRLFSRGGKHYIFIGGFKQKVHQIEVLIYSLNQRFYCINCVWSNSWSYWYWYVYTSLFRKPIKLRFFLSCPLHSIPGSYKVREVCEHKPSWKLHKRFLISQPFTHRELQRFKSPG